MIHVGVSEEEVWQALELLTGTVPMLAPAVAMAGGLAVLEVVKEVVMVDVSQHRCTWGNVAVGGGTGEECGDEDGAAAAADGARGDACAGASVR